MKSSSARGSQSENTVSPTTRLDRPVGLSASAHPISSATVIAEKIATPKAGECPYTIFLGAGASVSSGVPTVHGMIQSWREVIRQGWHNDADRAKDAGADFSGTAEQYFQELLENLKFIHKSDNEYSVLFKYLFQQREERQMHIEELLDGKRPGFGYYYLAGLITAKRFNRILTTNFDDLLNEALTTYYDNRPIVCAFDSAVTSIRIASQRPKIIKLHGDFLYDNIRSVDSELRRLDDNMEDKLKEMCKDYGLIVVGFAGNDESIMAPIREMVRRQEYLKMGLHWCLYLPNFRYNEINLDHQAVPTQLRTLILNHRDRVHLYSIESFDVLMDQIFRRCRCPRPPILHQPNRTNLPARFLETINHTRAAQIFTSQMADIERDIIHAMDESNDSFEYSIAKANSMWEMGKQARVQGQFEQAKSHFLQGIAVCSRLINQTGQPRINRVRAFARLSGCYAGLSKAAHEIGGDSPQGKCDFLQSLEDQISACKSGISMFYGDVPSGNEWFYLSSCYFNLLCAFGIRAMNAGEISFQDRAEIELYYQSFKDLDREGQRLPKLKRDSDVKPILPVFNELDSEI